MEQKQTPLEKDLTTKFPVLYVAFELGNSTWKMACSDGQDFLVGQAARLSAGFPEDTVFRDRALHNQVPLSATPAHAA